MCLATLNLIRAGKPRPQQIVGPLLFLVDNLAKDMDFGRVSTPRGRNEGECEEYVFSLLHVTRPTDFNRLGLPLAIHRRDAAVLCKIKEKLVAGVQLSNAIVQRIRP